MSTLLTPTMFDDFEFDVIMTRIPTYDGDVTDNPVETGFVVSDHFIRKPLQFDVTAIFTPTNVTWNARRGGYLASRLTDVETKLKAIRDKAEPGTLKTQDNVYTNMILLNFVLPRTVEDGKAIKATLKFREVPRVSVQTTAVPESTASTATAATNTTTDTVQTTAQDQAGGTDTNAGDAETTDVSTDTTSTNTESAAGTETADTANKSVLASIADTF